MVTWVAEKMLGKLASSVSKDEIYSSAALGLLDAVRRFDPSRGVKLKTYAAYRMRGTILDKLRDTDWVPRLARARKECEPQVKSITSFVFDPRNGNVEDPEPIERGPDPALLAGENDSWARLGQILPARELQVLELYYRDELTLKEIGVRMGLSESRVCQLHARALRRARIQLKDTP